MLGKFTLPWKRAADPLDGVKAAQSWWKAIQTDDMASLPKLVAEEVNRFIGGEVAITPTSMQSLMWLDDQVQSAFETQCLLYLQNLRMPKTVESKLWHLIMTLAHHMIHAYLMMIKEVRDGERPDLDPFLSRCIARTLNYLAVQAKWQYFRFLTPEKKFWSTVNQVYRLAEVKGVDSDAFQLYDSTAVRNTSCADEFIQIMMLATLNSGALTARQLDMADQWLDHWSHHVVMERKLLSGRYQYGVDLTGVSPAFRLNGEQTEPASLGRYWSTHELVEQMTLAKNALDGGKTIGLDDIFRQPGASELLKLLIQSWSPESQGHPKRGSDRVAVRKMVDVIHSMKEIYHHVKYDNERNTDPDQRHHVNTEEMLDMRQYGFVTERTRQRQAQALAATLQKHTVGVFETWVVNNESDGGYGAILPVVENDWIRLDALLGLRPEKTDHWQLAIVRRLSRVAEGQMYAGIQVLAYAPIAVEIRSQDGKLNGGLDAAGVFLASQGIFIQAKSNPQKVNGVVMRSADYMQDKAVVLVSMGREIRVRFREVLARGAEWVWARVDADE
ncbi:hypothetical protein HNQ59_003012 [Chitinivorax tropicus]|uniref:Uncharacterized protein n=1 Tax=Chitinivorax tropicus TaxID=714531 RepID=A0A840MKK2_9PROT|nr:hypothetical protein [Chitinivorax tropicus]MBB5019704.1 hypothetical protein [Chitinivorax tropicus]